MYCENCFWQLHSENQKYLYQIKMGKIHTKLTNFEKERGVGLEKLIHVADDSGRRVQKGRGGGFFRGNNGLRHGQSCSSFEGFWRQGRSEVKRKDRRKLEKEAFFFSHMGGPNETECGLSLRKRHVVGYEVGKCCVSRF